MQTPRFRVSFPNVFKAKRNELNDKDEFSLVALFPKNADMTELREAVKKCIVDKWGADKTKWPANIRMPFRDQAERAKNVNGKQVLPDGYEAGSIFINLKSTQRPGVVNQSVERIIDETEFYAGCWAIASVNCFAYDKKGNRGVSIGLMNVQKVADGDPLGRRTKAENDFAPIVDDEEDNRGNRAPSNAADLFS